VGVAGAQRRDGGVESGGVTHTGVEVAGGEGAGHAADGAGARQRRAPDGGRLALVFGAHFAGDVDLGPGDVGVHVHAAGHDDQASCVEGFIWPGTGVGRRRDDLAVLDPQVHDDAVDVIRGVVDGAVGDS